MSYQKSKRKVFIEKLRTKLRFVVMNDETLQEKWSFKLTLGNIILGFSGLSITLILITVVVIAFTPLREYIPGYGAEVKLREKFFNLSFRLDSLEQAISDRDEYIKIIKNVLTESSELYKVKEEKHSPKTSEIFFNKSVEDSLLRAEIEEQEKYLLLYSDENISQNTIRNYFFFTPLKGMVINGFNPSERHYGIDIISEKDQPVKATLEGTIVYADWSLETGYVVVIQHSNNLISVYKHNSAILKKCRDYVRTGEAIAIVGNTGELTTGPHLHFELWYNGNPVNPLEYISF